MKKVKDTDFLHISARIKMFETKLLTREDINRMLASPSAEDAAKVVMDKGYPVFDSTSMDSLEKSLEAGFKSTMELLAPYMPNRYFIDFFKVRHDYNNIKAIIKGDALMEDIGGILSENGIYSRYEIRDIVRDGLTDGVEDIMADTIVRAREILARTKDPQLSDISIDMGMYEHLKLLAEKSGSDFLRGYFKNIIDGDNLRAAVRVIRMKKGPKFMEKVIAEGGNVPKSLFVKEDISIDKIYRGTAFEKAAKLAEDVVEGRSPFAKLDIAVDNILMEYARQARYISFGDKTVLGYIVAREREINQIRTIMTGKASKRSLDKISESLRLNYV